MSDRQRNIIVGLTVLVALCMLGVMIVLFVGMPDALSRGYKIQIRFDETQNAKTGDPVKLSGMRVGKISDVRFTENDPRKGVTFILLIDRHVRVPADITARIQSQGFVGSAYIDLAPGGKPLLDQDTGKPLEFIPTDRTVTIQGDITAKSGMFPAEITEAITDMRGGFKHLSALAENLNRLTAPEPTTAPDSGEEKATVGDLLTTITKVGQTFDELQQIIGDKENKANIKAALAQFVRAGAETTQAMSSVKSFAEEARDSARQITKSAGSAQEDLSSLTQSLIGSTEKISTLMAGMNKVITKVESGEGTIGKLMNDPKLYQNFAEAAVHLEKLVKEMRQLAQAWKAQGVGVKLK